MPHKWISKAIKKPGVLRETVKQKFGDKGFTKRGTIKLSVLRELADGVGKTARRARCALNLRKVGKKRKRR